MSTTQPIRDRETLAAFKGYYLTKEPNQRNHTLIVLGLNTALRINDLLHLTWNDIYQSDRIRDHIVVTERKTGKENRIFLNEEAKKAIAAYSSMAENKENPYLFCSIKNNTEPLSRFQAYRIIRRAAESVGLEDHISCHSLRKTFGYHAWKQGTPPALLMSLYNHSSFHITMRYLCIEQDDKDKVYQNIKL